MGTARVHEVVGEVHARVAQEHGPKNEKDHPAKKGEGGLGIRYGRAKMESAVMAAKAKLMKADASGMSLHDHLSATIAKIISDDRDDALAMFEQISMDVKKAAVLPRREYIPVRSGRWRRGAPTARAHVIPPCMF